MTVDKQTNSSRWLVDEVFELIDCVKKCECIYNPLDKNYFCRPFVENKWREIDDKFGRSPGTSLAKWTNLRICFRRDYSTFIRENTKPSWIFFDKMYFLHPYLRKKRMTEGLESHIQEALEQISSITRGNFRNFVEHVETCEAEAQEEIVEEEGIWDHNFLVKEESLDSHDQTYDIEVSEGHQPAEIEVTSDEIPSRNKRKHDDDIDDSNSDISPDERSPNKKIIPNDDPPEPPPVLAQPLADTDNSNQLAINCECKSDPDAMFLLSLLPDIKLLSGREKGKFKIEIQKIIQDLLYPDDN